MNIINRIHEFVTNGRIDIRKEILIIYISSNGDVDKTKAVVKKIAEKYEDQEDVKVEYLCGLDELFASIQVEHPAE